MAQATRIEHDFLGELEIPGDAYYGIQTLRATENFNITGVSINHVPPLIQALGYVKKAVTLANMELGVLDENIGDAICHACDELIEGKYHDQFIVDMIQGGAGTSTNMNANEVIANIALEILGHKKGEYDFVHPNNHVNCSQSTNGIYPSALKIALHMCLSHLMVNITNLQTAFRKKGKEFQDIYKMGRTQLQDAVPMTLGQEFDAFAATFNSILERVSIDQDLILTLNIGATAIGTGLNAPPYFGKIAIEHLRKLTGIPVIPAKNLIEATWDTNAFLQISGVLKQISVKLSKICNDLRLLSSGPRTGINEINLPQMQPGSSIMPGKVNPVIPEVVNQVAFYVIGCDTANTFACEAGQLQLNVMEPVIAFNLLSSIYMLGNACDTLREKCIVGITANSEHCTELVKNSVGIVTALAPRLGYEATSKIAKQALAENKSVREIVLEKKLLKESEIDTLLNIEEMAFQYMKVDN